MSHSAIDWDVAPEGEPDLDQSAPAVLPTVRPHATRCVGVIKAFSPRKSYGVVEMPGEHAAAIFNIDDVAPCDRPNLDRGQAVTFFAVKGPDGLAAKAIRIDMTTLPPWPDDAMLQKGWR
jgi:cold shock CspA family protein